MLGLGKRVNSIGICYHFLLEPLSVEDVSRMQVVIKRKLDGTNVIHAFRLERNTENEDNRKKKRQRFILEVFFKFHVTRFHCHDIQWQTETKKSSITSQ